MLMSMNADAEGKGTGLAIEGNRMPPKTVLLIATIFWTYVTVSNLLYAHSMQINTSQMTHAVLFAPWPIRVVQHLILFPPLCLCFWASTFVGWAPTRGAPVQLALGCAFAALSYFAMLAAEMISARLDFGALGLISIPMVDQSRQSFGGLWTASFTMFLLTYSFGIALVTGFTVYRRFRDSELRNSVLQQGWTAARLAALRMQLSPHTLFNLLHTIRGQINLEPQVARSMVVQLADLLRRLLSAGEREFSLLSDELAFVELYLELQRQRFADRLTVVAPAADAQAAVWVPSLILQPLVENAVVHGLVGHDGPVVVTIEVLIGEENLSLRVVNTTAPNRTAGKEGIGLRNIRERLDVQFGRRAELRTYMPDTSTWSAQITLPLLHEHSGVHVTSPASGHRWM